MSFRLPFLFIITGLIGFTLYNLGSIVSFAGWIADPLRSPQGWSNAHLLILGWGTIIAMGALYQLMNVVLQGDIFSLKLGYAHYICFTLGTAGLVAGFLFMRVTWIAVFAALAVAGVLLFVFNILATLFRAAKWNAVTISAGCAVVYLAATVVLGLAMGLDFACGFWIGTVHERIFHAHMWFGLIGWFGLLISGISYKLLPMFYLSHGVSNRLPNWICGLWNAGVLIGALAMLSGNGTWLLGAALLCLTIAVYLYLVFMMQVRKTRHKKDPGIGVRCSVYCAILLALLFTACLICVLFCPGQWRNEETLRLAGWIYLWGWVAMTILGYLTKIVPFLWWTYKYGPRVGKGKIPTMNDLLKEGESKYALGAVTACYAVLLIGLSLDQDAWIHAGGTLMSLCLLYYTFIIFRVFAR